MARLKSPLVAMRVPTSGTGSVGLLGDHLLGRRTFMRNDSPSVHDHSGVVEQPVQHGDGGGVLGVVVRRRCCPRDLAVGPTKRSAMSLKDSWSLVVMVAPPC
jgi:hypothetical protein